MKIETVFVIGAGAMGAGIAQAAAEAGCRVYLNDLTAERVLKGVSGIVKSLDRMVAKGKMTPELKDAVLSRISVSDSYEAVGQVDLVLEAIYENLDAKRGIFKEIGGLARPDAILASNTSSLSLTAIAAVVPQPERFIGLHFFNPVPVMRLLELVVGLQTSQETIAAGLAFGSLLNKETIVAKDSPGFIVNRALNMMLNEAVFLYQEGVGSAEDIDKGMMLGCNHPMGPLTLIDLVGVDIVCAVLEAFCRDFADSKYRPAPLLRQMVAANRLGIKTGRGFYAYDSSGKKL
ncbi:3-hydroxybutyryl-CoA dehydrogenase [bioreactor metagenome]|uniref:3-hydroxybutyryl-CoA dehydrogenase n=1 Tax=bioreactor metagenome TaxID=1076179 RepID=A0A644WC55_9ZZZZ